MDRYEKTREAKRRLMDALNEINEAAVILKENDGPFVNLRGVEDVRQKLAETIHGYCWYTETDAMEARRAEKPV